MRITPHGWFPTTLPPVEGVRTSITSVCYETPEMNRGEDAPCALPSQGYTVRKQAPVDILSQRKQEREMQIEEHGDLRSVSLSMCRLVPIRALQGPGF